MASVRNGVLGDNASCHSGAVVTSVVNGGSMEGTDPCPREGQTLSWGPLSLVALQGVSTKEFSPRSFRGSDPGKTLWILWLEPLLQGQEGCDRR